MLQSCKFYRKIRVFVCSVQSHLYFTSRVITFLLIKKEITPSIKANYRLKFSQYVALNYVTEKKKLRCKLSYKLSKEEYGYDPLLYIPPYPTCIQFKHFLDGIHHCVTVLGKWIFDGNFPFELHLTQENFKYCCINDNETKGRNRYKWVLKAIRLFPKENTKSVIQK